MSFGRYELKSSPSTCSRIIVFYSVSTVGWSQGGAVGLRLLCIAAIKLGVLSQ